MRPAVSIDGIVSVSGILADSAIISQTLAGFAGRKQKKRCPGGSAHFEESQMGQKDLAAKTPIRRLRLCYIGEMLYGNPVLIYITISAGKRFTPKPEST